jgi:hypothetical protein
MKTINKLIKIPKNSICNIGSRYAFIAAFIVVVVVIVITTTLTTIVSDKQRLMCIYIYIYIYSLVRFFLSWLFLLSSSPTMICTYRRHCRRMTDVNGVPSSLSLLLMVLPVAFFTIAIAIAIAIAITIVRTTQKRADVPNKR